MRKLLRNLLILTVFLSLAGIITLAGASNPGQQRIPQRVKLGQYLAEVHVKWSYRVCRSEVLTSCSVAYNGKKFKNWEVTTDRKSYKVYGSGYYILNYRNYKYKSGRIINIIMKPPEAIHDTGSNIPEKLTKPKFPTIIARAKIGKLIRILKPANNQVIHLNSINGPGLEIIWNVKKPATFYLWKVSSVNTPVGHEIYYRIPVPASNKGRFMVDKRKLEPGKLYRIHVWYKAEDFVFSVPVHKDSHGINQLGCQSYFKTAQL